MTTDHPAPISAVVRWLAVSLVVFTIPLLVLGGLTTSRRAGMDDPDWPTQPLHLFFLGQEIQEKSPGYFLEHTHRLSAWVVGGLACALAFAAWLSGPDKKSRLPAVVAVFLLLGVYGWFHGQMMAADKSRQATGAFSWPWLSISATVGMSMMTVALAVWQLRRDDPARWVRFTATLVLLGVMAQGLLGGLRVFLNSQIGIKDTVGVEFSQLHGLFAQLVFSGMVLLPFLAGPRRAVKELGESERNKLKWLSVAVVLAVFVQLIWAVGVRHAPNALTQRLHLLTAFLVAGLVVWLAVRVLTSPGARRPLAFAAWHLLAMLAVQLLLGVEAWMGKFAATGPEAAIPPTERAITTSAVLIRTGHQLIGAALLASAVAVAFRVLRTPAISVPLSPRGEGNFRRVPTRMAVMSTVAQPVAAEEVAFTSLKARLADYVELSKPKIAAMALVTVAVGFLLGARPGLAMVQPLLHTLVGAAVVAAGGSALNHWLERRADARMRRTANRPLVTGRLHHVEALVFGVTLGLLGVGYLWFALPSPAAAVAAAATAVLYVGVYTPLKRHTSWNTVVGAIPGALPPVIGWCGATGGMDLPGWVLFAILFVWQLPHFYSIAFMHRDDYARGGMKMLPNVDYADARVTGWATFATALLLVPVTALPFFLGVAGWVYLVGSLPVALWFLWRCLKFARNRTTPTARTVLRGSLVYLLAVMALFVADGVVPRYFAG